MDNLDWRKSVPKELIDKMFPRKVDPNYKNERPSFMDLFAEIMLITAKRSSCLFAETAALIIDEEKNRIVCSGYNGSVAGGENCFEVGCSRIVDGQLKKGAGLCRGLHAEVNAFVHAATYGINVSGLSMIVSRKPCYDCALMIANSGLKTIYYLFDYNREGEDKRPEKAILNSGKKLVKYESDYLLALKDYTDKKSDANF